MSYLDYAYPKKGGPFDKLKLDSLNPFVIPEPAPGGGEYYFTWRNVIARNILSEKEPRFDANDNPERIPPNVTGRYQDQNYFQTVQPLQLFRPSTLTGVKYLFNKKSSKMITVKDEVTDGIKGIVKRAFEKKLKVKAVGTGHSFSDIMTTPDYLVYTDDLKEMLEDENGEIRHTALLRDDIKKDGYAFYADKVSENPSLAEFEAGIKIKDLNEQLWDKKLSLANMGTYQGQSFIGAVSTSTHGTGQELGPLPDMIKSIVIVCDTGLVLRIEPKNGITQPTANVKSLKGPISENLPQGFRDLMKSDGLFEAHRDDRGVDYLVQDNDWFNSTLVNVGTFGIVYSLIIEVLPRFCLLETMEVTTWDDLKNRLLEQQWLLDRYIRPDDDVQSFELHEIFEKKEFKTNLKIKGTNETLIVDKIRQAGFLFHPNKYDGKIYCRIIRQYYVDYAQAKKNDWLNEHDKGRILDPVAKTFAAMSLDTQGETLKYDAKPRETWYKKRVRQVLQAVIFQPISGNAYETIDQPVENYTEADLPSKPEKNGFYLNRNYRVYLKPSDLSGYGIETGFGMNPLSQSTVLNEEQKKQPAYIAAIDEIIRIAEEHWKEGKYVQTGNAAIRFVKGSRAYLSPQRNELTCMVEMLNVSDTHGGKELFYRYQRELFRFGGRPHWGLDLSVTTGNNNLLEKMYPMFSVWKKVYDSLNCFGTFNNRFTDRMGLSVQDFPMK